VALDQQQHAVSARTQPSEKHAGLELEACTSAQRQYSL
jgi:hypothetical protein